MKPSNTFKGLNISYVEYKSCITIPMWYTYVWYPQCHISSEDVAPSLSFCSYWAVLYFRHGPAANSETICDRSLIL